MLAALKSTNGELDMEVRMTTVRRAIPHKGKEAQDVAARMMEFLGRTLGVDVAWGLTMGGDAGVLHMYVDFESLAKVEEAGSIWQNEEWNDLYAESEHCLELGHTTFVHLR